MKLDKADAERFLAMLYGGRHHIPGKLREWGEGWCITTHGELATFDGDLMTRLVVLAHRECIRVAVESVNFHLLRVTLHRRVRAHENAQMWARHPTMFETLKRLDALEKLEPATDSDLRAAIVAKLESFLESARSPEEIADALMPLFVFEARAER